MPRSRRASAEQPRQELGQVQPPHAPAVRSVRLPVIVFDPHVLERKFKSDVAHVCSHNGVFCEIPFGVEVFGTNRQDDITIKNEKHAVKEGKNTIKVEIGDKAPADLAVTIEGTSSCISAKIFATSKG